jgi:hypothetical protein
MEVLLVTLQIAQLKLEEEAVVAVVAVFKITTRCLKLVAQEAPVLQVEL